MKILLIEDTEEHARLARQSLALYDKTSEIGYVGTAEEALETLDKHPYDLILCDYFLPGMSGLQFLRTVRQKRKLDIPIIMITSLGHVKMAVECLKSGANDYVAKDDGYVDLLPQAVDQVYRQAKAERENRELQRQIKRKKEEAEQANRRLVEYQRQIIHAQKMSAIITLVRGICHELNNPLTGILGYAQLLQESIVGEGVDDLREIETCAQRCREIITKLAKFCRHEKVSQGPVNINEVLDESLSFVEYYANRHRVKLIGDLQAGLEPIVASAHDLRQAFLAVFLNGIQAMTHGGVLKVRSQIQDSLLYVSVEDSGEGIPADNMERIFTPFFTTRDFGEGTGMGLAIAYGIMQDHDGSILVDSVVGKGTKMSLVFPIRKPSPVPAEAAPSPVAS